uniref:Uncharacterized protein LOC113794821 n=1 Tax=Dermatophagoides pteronyssinus TaxID=6956 RepID=A0A6P6Y5T7_DERPT|nr:uncharacterized protein LOC113794821 [Dermatophagoides pteronyssinus]
MATNGIESIQKSSSELSSSNGGSQHRSPPPTMVKTNGVNGHHHNHHNGGDDHQQQPDLIMMTPLKKELDHTILRVERIDRRQLQDQQNVHHIAGGQHQGIIINKQIAQSQSQQFTKKFDLRLAFKVFLVNAITNVHQQESRELRFWFDHDHENQDDDDHHHLNNGNGINVNGNGNSKDQNYLQCAQSFFRQLVDPKDFPKNYVGFIMKLMKTMQQSMYRPLIRIELEVKQIDEPFERPLSSSTSTSQRSSMDFDSNNSNTNNNHHHHYNQLLTEEKVREMIESAYPNPLSLPDIAATTCSNPEDVERLVDELCSKGVARLTDLGQVIRVTSDEQQVKRVSQMPKVIRSQQPTVAIITAQFCEKLAVDSMIDNKDTYVRYKGEGDSNQVYTLGNIGQHRVVATKLPAVGNSRSAMIAAGNTTTRLLGTFQHVEYVFLVGIGGGVPHYTDYQQHVRLGDIVVSTSPRRNHYSASSSPINNLAGDNGGHNDHGHGNNNNGHSNSNSMNKNRPRQLPPTCSDFIYVHCEKLRSSPDEPMNASNSTWKELQTVDSFNYRFWCPLSLELQEIARQIYNETQQDDHNECQPSWERYIEEARNRLQESDDLEFVRPDENTDKLYMSIGTNDLIEMAHPEPDPQNEENYRNDPRKRGMPKIHFGAVGSGRLAVGNEQLRQDIALKFGIKAFDIEFDTVIESIFGNRKDRYIIIRGIADYKDGSRKKEWQPYAALSAAAYMKAILCRLQPMI